MLRICLCLLIAFVSAGVAAREVKLSGANSGSCPERTIKPAATRSVERSEAPPAPQPKASKPTVSSDADGGSRLQAPRWHRFLPGMFR